MKVIKEGHNCTFPNRSVLHGTVVACDCGKQYRWSRRRGSYGKWIRIFNKLPVPPDPPEQKPFDE